MLPLLPLSIVLGATTFVVAQSASVPDPTVTTGFLARRLEVDGTAHRYEVYVPPGYTKTRSWPLLMFLNDMGECGTDGKQQVEVGLGPAIRHDPVRWPFVVVFPQKPDRDSQWSEHEALVMETLAATEQEYRIDADRRFLTGMSQGGAGTWALGAKHADVWAAIAPVCGYGSPAEVGAALREMPIWAFHGEDDTQVLAQHAKDLCAAVDAAGGHAALTLYPNIAHNSWDRAYRESALAEWLRVIEGRLSPDVRQALLKEHSLLTRRHYAGSAEWDMLHPESGLGLRVFTVTTGRDGVQEVETLTLANGWLRSAKEWQVRREMRPRKAVVDAPEPVAVPGAEGAKLLLECMQLLVRGGLYELPLEEGHGETAGPGADSIGFDGLVGFGGRSLSYLPRHIRVDDPNRKLEREALRTVAAKLRAVR